MIITDAILCNKQLYTVKFARSILEDLFDNKVTHTEVIKMVNQAAEEDPGLLDGHSKFFQLFEAYIIVGEVKGRVITVEHLITRKCFFQTLDEMG